MISPSHIHGVIKSIADESSTNAKLEILKSERSNTGLQEFLKLVYNPRHNFFMKPDKRVSPRGSSTLDFSEAIDFLDSLSSRRLVGNAAREKYMEIMTGLDRVSGELLYMILDRDVRAGINAKQINKVWPGLIPTTPYMRCSLPDAARVKTWAWGTEEFVAYSQRKEDGAFANITQAESGFEVTTRNGTAYPEFAGFRGLFASLDAISGFFNEDHWGHALQFHGELLVAKDGKVLPREKGNGVLNSLLKSGEIDPGYSIRFVCWDVIPASAAKCGRFDTTYAARFALLENVVYAVGANTNTKLEPAFSLVETHRVKTWEEACKHFVDVTRAGGEGTIVKRGDAPWADGTSLLQVKMKVSFDVDLVITGFNPGEGKNAATFGSIACTSSCGNLEVSVSGFTDAMRASLHARREEVIGKVMTVTANSVMTPDGPGKKHSLFLPRFVEIREDKTEGDDLSRILSQYRSVMRGE